MNPMTGFSIPLTPSSAIPTAPGAYAAPVSMPVAGDRLRFSGKAQATEPADTAPDTFTRQQKLMGGLKGAVKNIFNKKALIKDTLIGMVIAAVTAWAPGSQLFTIPMYMCIMGAFRAIHGFEAGYNDPTLAAFGKNKAE